MTWFVNCSNCLDLPRPSMLVQSASCSHLDRLCVSHSETESIVPVRGMYQPEIGFERIKISDVSVLRVYFIHGMVSS